LQSIPPTGKKTSPFSLNALNAAMVRRKALGSRLCRAFPIHGSLRAVRRSHRCTFASPMSDTQRCRGRSVNSIRLSDQQVPCPMAAKIIAPPPKRISTGPTYMEHASHGSAVVHLSAPHGHAGQRRAPTDPALTVEHAREFFLGDIAPSGGDECVRHVQDAIPLLVER
jgi:hypothetical protein